MKDLFSGSLGRTNNHGGSKMFSTPHTVKIAPEYFINININRNFVTCSLDGRLWAYGTGTTYVLFAFRWNENTSQLEQAGYLNFRGEKIKARGLDWLLTDKSIIFVSDDEPYIKTEKLFDGNGRFLFSILRSGITQGSGFDSSTNQAWGKGQDGNNEGWGFFSKNNISEFDMCYASLPAVGDWYITPNFLVRKNFISSYNDMRVLRPLIPLEFNMYGDGTVQPTYGTGYSKRPVQLVHRNNMLFGRGVTHIGRIYLLPAVFSEDGDTLEFYLYISPDYVHNQNDDDWLNSSIIASENASIYGFITEKSDSLNENLCTISDNEKVVVARDGQWQELNSRIFIDSLNSSAVAVSDEGITLFHDNISVLQCKALEQWVAPSGNISCITDNLICCTCDNGLLATNIARQFSRTLADNKRLPLSAITYKSNGNEHFRLSLGETNETRKNIAVNHFASNEIKKSILWEDIYRQAISIELINTLEQPFVEVVYVNGYPLFSSGLRCNITRIINREYQVHIEVPASEVNVGSGNASDGAPKFTDIVHDVFIDLFCIDTNTGMFVQKHFSHSYENIVGHYILWEGTEEEREPEFSYVYWPVGQKLYSPTKNGITIQDGILGVFSYYKESIPLEEGWYGINVVTSEPEFTPLGSVEELIVPSLQSGSEGLSIKFLAFPNGSLNELQEGCSSAAYAIFSEKYTNANFALHLPSLLYVDNNGYKTGFFAEAKSFSFYEFHNDYSTWHFVANDTKDKIAILKSEIFNDIFNFYDELQRSALS